EQARSRGPDERIGDELPHPALHPDPGGELQHGRHDRRRLEEAQGEGDEPDAEDDQHVPRGRSGQAETAEATHAAAGIGVAGYQESGPLTRPPYPEPPPLPPSRPLPPPLTGRA